MAARSICSKCGKPAVSKPVIDRGYITVVEYCSNGHSYQRRFQSLDDARRYLQMKAIEAGDFTYRPDAEALAPMESGAETLESRLKPAPAPVKAKPATKPAPAPLPPMEEVKLKHPLWDVDDATIRRLFDETATWKSKSESKTHLSEAKNWYRLAQEEANMNDDPTTPDRPYRQVLGLPNGWGWDRDGERRGGLIDGNGHHILTCSHEPPCVLMDSPCYVMAWEVQLNRRLNTQSGVLGDSRYRITREDGHWVVFDTDTQHFIRGTNGASPGEAAGFAVTVIGDVNAQRPNPGGHVINPEVKEVPLPTGSTIPLPAEYSLNPYDNGAQQALRYEKQSTPLSYGATDSPFNLIREAWEHKVRRENPTSGQGDPSLHVTRLSTGAWAIGNLEAIQEAVRNSDFSKVATGADPLEAYENFSGIAPKTRSSYSGKVTAEDVAQNAWAKVGDEKYRVRLIDGRVISLYVPTNRGFRAHVMFRYEEDGKPKEVSFISLPDKIIQMFDRSKDDVRHKAIEKFFEQEVYQPQLKYWADKAGIPAVGERPRRRLDAEDLEVQKMFEQLQPKPHRRTHLSITDPALVIPAPQRWIVLTETMSGLAPIDTCSEGKGPDHPCTYDSELLAWAEVDDDIAEMQRQFDEGERDDVDTRDMYAVVPYDPAIHDQQWREATGQSITPTPQEI